MHLPWPALIKHQRLHGHAQDAEYSKKFDEVKTKIIMMHVSPAALDTCYSKLETMTTCAHFLNARRAAFRRLYVASRRFARATKNGKRRYTEEEMKKLDDSKVDEGISKLTHSMSKLPNLGAEIDPADVKAATGALASAGVQFSFPPQFKFDERCTYKALSKVPRPRSQEVKLKAVALDDARPYQITWLLLRTLSKSDWTTNTVRHARVRTRCEGLRRHAGCRCSGTQRASTLWTCSSHRPCTTS